MTSPYSSIINYQGDDFQEFLEKLLLIEVFKNVITKYGYDKGILRCVIHYIVMAYSKDSDKIYLNSDWHKNKKRIYEEAMLPPNQDLIEAIVYLKEDAIRLTIQEWLNFQDEPIFSQIQMLKDLLVEMQIAANSPIKKASGIEIDYDQKFKNAGYVGDLRVMIKDLESELIQNDARLKDAVKELRAVKSKNTLTVEKFV